MLLLGQILTVIIAIFILFLLIRAFRSNASFLSKENWRKSFFSMGILALFLIGFVALLVIWLRLTG